MPAANWYGVTLMSAQWGSDGDSNLTVTAGGLGVVNDEPHDFFTMACADSAGNAIRQAMIGSVTTGANTYTITPGNLADNASAHAPFLLVPTSTGYEIRLEDLAGTRPSATGTTTM